MDRQLGDPHRDDQFARSLAQWRREHLLQEPLPVKGRAQPAKRVEEAGQRIAAGPILRTPGPMLAGDHGGEPSAAARQMADQRAYIPFGAGRRIPELIRPDADDDIGRHAPGAAVEIPRIRHNVPSSTMTPAEPATPRPGPGNAAGPASEAATAGIISPGLAKRSGAGDAVLVEGQPGRGQIGILGPVELTGEEPVPLGAVRCI